MFFRGGREGGRERLGQILLQFGSKKLLFSFQFPTWQKDKKNVMFCQRKNKSHHHPTKGKRKCDVLPKEKQKP
jgi:hypothetical protein